MNKHKNIDTFGRRVGRYQREVIIIRKSKKDRQHNGLELEDTKGR